MTVNITDGLTISYKDLLEKIAGLSIIGKDNFRLIEQNTESIQEIKSRYEKSIEYLQNELGQVLKMVNDMNGNLMAAYSEINALRNNREDFS